MKSVPEIRFPGFTDLWELRKVGEFAVESCDKGHNGQEALKLTVKLHTKGVCKMEEKGQGSDNTQYYVRHAGQLIYGKQNFFNGAIGIVPQSLDGYESTKDVPAFDIDDNVCVEWFYQYIARPGIYKSQEVNCTGTGSKRFHVNAFFDMNIPIPLIEEQKKISDYFKAIDNLITLQEQRCQVLKRLKQCMLQKMFPKDGSDTPEIRFPGFTGSWEQRKAKSLFVSTADKGHPELPVLSATQDRGMIRRDENSINIYHDKKNEEGYKRVLPGQFVIHLRSFQGGFAHSAIEGITSPAYTVFGFSEPEKHNPNYWKYVFTSKEFIRRLETVTYGIRDGRSISYDEFLTMDFVYPMQDEQTKIANYLDTFDNLITLSEKKCKVLKKLKQCMLQKMFV